jgi:hypothetical protein
MEDDGNAGEILFNYYMGIAEPRLGKLLENPRYVMKLEMIQRHLIHNYP